MRELCRGFADMERFEFAFFNMRYPAALLRVCLAGLALSSLDIISSLSLRDVAGYAFRS